MSGRGWKKRESTYLWDNYLAGASLLQLRRGLNRTGEDVAHRVKQFAFNVDDIVVRYEPFRRISRKGLRFSERERRIVAEHKKRNVPLEATARLLARNVTELDDSWKQVPAAKSDRVLAPSLDLVLAHRYIYHIYRTPIISNKAYDDLRKEEEEYGAGGKVLKDLGVVGIGPRRIKTLALYLVERYEDEHGKPPPRIKFQN
jgi:hypothetical protein